MRNAISNGQQITCALMCVLPRGHINTRDTIKSAFNFEEDETERKFHEHQMSCVHVAYLISIITFVHIEQKASNVERVIRSEHWLCIKIEWNRYDVRSFIFHSLHTHYTLVWLFPLFYSVLILIVKCLCLYFILFYTHFHNVCLCLCWCVQCAWVC